MTSTFSRILELWPQTPTSGPSPRSIPNTDRWHSLTQLLADLHFNTGAEIGTERGQFAKRLCHVNPNLHLYCIDPWLAYKGYREHVSQAKLDDFYEEAKWRLEPYDCTLIRKTSVEAARDFKDGQLDWVYIDANHDLPNVIADLHAWIPKVRKNGIIAGHDFLRRTNPVRYQCHVVEAVHAWTQAYMVDPWFVLGRKKIIEGELREKVRSFMWVKE